MSAVHVGTADRFIPKNPDFQARHIGPRDTDQQDMLNTLGFQVWRNGKMSGRDDKKRERVSMNLVRQREWAGWREGKGERNRDRED